jgi:hypothetical protein
MAPKRRADRDEEGLRIGLQRTRLLWVQTDASSAIELNNLIWQCAHQGGSISPLIILTTCDASANSEVTIAKVTLTKLSLGRRLIPLSQGAPYDV